MLLISPSTWPYGSTKPKSLVSGPRCVYIWNSGSRTNLEKAGIPVAILTLKDYCRFHNTLRGPSGEITFPTPSQITDNL